VAYSNCHNIESITGSQAAWISGCVHYGLRAKSSVFFIMLENMNPILPAIKFLFAKLPSTI
jgi:hypothetical protein